MTDDRVDAIRGLWSAGSYEAVGDMWASVGQALVDELSAEPGLAGRRVLDAACGTGNTTLALARAHARVVGVDLTPALLDVARQRGDEAGLSIEWREGDLLDLPAEDESFDVVTSTFGALIADDPFACAAELARVCRPGGTIAVTAWARGGPFETYRGVVEEVAGELGPADRPDAEAWAEADGLRERFAATPAELVDVERREVGLPFPSASAAVHFYEANSGPLIRTAEAVRAAGQDWDAVRAEVIRRWEGTAEHRSDGIVLRAPYGRALLSRA